MPRLQRTGSAPLRTRCRRVRSGRCRDRATLYADRLVISEGLWPRRRTTSIPLDAVTRVEWWTEQPTFNLGLHREGEEPLFLYLEGAGRWKFAIDERLQVLRRDHSGMPRLRSSTGVTPASRGDGAADDSRAAHAGAAALVSESGDHLPAEIELTLGDGSRRPLAENWVATDLTATHTMRVGTGQPCLSLPLRAVKAIRWAMRGDTVEMQLDYRDGANATLTLDDEGEVRLDAEDRAV